MTNIAKPPHIPRWKACAQEIVNLIPAAIVFAESIEAGSCLPLSIGIYDQLRQEIEKLNLGSDGMKRVKRAISGYCGNHAYFTELSNDLAARHNLDGTQHELVSDTHRGFAIERLKIMQQNHISKVEKNESPPPTQPPQTTQVIPKTSTQPDPAEQRRRLLALKNSWQKSA
jgi:sRNA-binding protein